MGPHSRQFAEDWNGHSAGLYTDRNFTMTAVTAGDTYKYTTVYNPTSKRLQMVVAIDRAAHKQLRSKSERQLGVPFRQRKISGEVHNYQDDMIGSPSNYAVFGDLSVRDASDNWHSSDAPTYTWLVWLRGFGERQRRRESTVDDRRH